MAVIDQKVKYDRQLRLWHAHGQAALESANLCMLGSNNLAGEVLKNLILPGIGSFTIVDDANCTGKDVGSNFFLSPSDIGESRAKSLCTLLQELNSSVKGNYVEKSLKQAIQEGPNFFKMFSMVVICDGIEKDILDVAAICHALNIPLVWIRIYGFIGYCRILVAEHTVIESHPESILDLRLDIPWEKLANLPNEIEFNNLPSHVASHIPFPILILKAIQIWKLDHDRLPKDRQEKNQFHELIKLIVGPTADDENVREAISNCYRVFSGTSINSDVTKYMSDSNADNITNLSSKFWILVAALKKFVQTERSLPVPGVVPDMKSDTESYIKLQRLYREKAKVDLENFKSHLNTITSGIQTQITDDEIERFCKYANYIRVLKSRSLAEEYSSPIPNDLGHYMEDLGDNNMIFYLLLRGVDRFFKLHNRYPGTSEENSESDSLAFEALFSTFLKEQGVSANDTKPYIREMIRAGACELPSMAALMGGVGSQEIIKIITKQYIPLDNTLVFSAVKSTSTVFKM